MKRNDKTTMPAPIQYVPLDCWELRMIWPTIDRGIVKLSPTVVTSGEVSSIEYAQQKSDTSDTAELIYASLLVDGQQIEKDAHQDD